MALGEGRRRAMAHAVAVVAAVMMLAACSANADPAEPTPSSATMSPEPSESTESTETADLTPEVEKPTPPDAMRRDDVAGAEAAAQYFLELYPYVYATGDLAEWEAMSHPDCTFCASASESARKLTQEGGHQAGGRLVFNFLDSRAPSSDGDFFVVWLDAHEEALRRVDSSGLVIASHDGTLVEFDVALLNQETKWLVRGIDVRSGEGEAG
ncbi:hypothetical protein FE374_12175 [Georgenia yuyongxinii]|uniref:DUF6318 domain-containing protein n=1 Tax=Georgenia yuyongxinii TaxID=2589797 RepID=A0A5B8CAW4_9MICO|nr:DUF6318 family protein [Georgenia yuyongxinii]QDC25266.1 hypothetical protein FE374_12175 [Georgenia yuyongxinii]